MVKRKIISYNPKLKKLALKLRKNMTFAEVLLWDELKQRKMKGYHFNRQRPIDNYIVDFYCKDLQLAIEVDGYTHTLDDVYENDKIRQKRLESLGVEFLRFEDEEVKKDMFNVLRAIEQWIVEWEEKNPPLPLPGGELTRRRGI